MSWSDLSWLDVFNNAKFSYRAAKLKLVDSLDSLVVDDEIKNFDAVLLAELRRLRKIVNEIPETARNIVDAISPGWQITGWEVDVSKNNVKLRLVRGDAAYRVHRFINLPLDVFKEGDEACRDFLETKFKAWKEKKEKDEAEKAVRAEKRRLEREVAKEKRERALLEILKQKYEA